MKKLKQILLVAGSVLLLTGCGANSQKTIEENNQQKEEAITEGETELTYDQTSIDLLTNALSCEVENAESIIRSLGRQNIGNLLSAELIDSENGYKVLIKDINKKSYILYIGRNYYLDAIQEDNNKGNFIYYEVDD